MKTETKTPHVEVRSIDGVFAVTVERPGSTLRLSKSFLTENEAVEYANTVLREYPLETR